MRVRAEAEQRAGARQSSRALGAPHFSRIVFNESCSARLTISQRFHATGSINFLISRLTQARRSFGSIASSSQQRCPKLRVFALIRCRESAGYSRLERFAVSNFARESMLASPLRSGTRAERLVEPRMAYRGYGWPRPPFRLLNNTPNEREGPQI